MLSNARCTSFSLLLSNALVASSNINIFGLHNIALAIAIRCFCPPESLLPRIPTIYSYLSSLFSMNSFAYASLHASFIISSMFSLNSFVINSSLPNMRLCRIDLLNNTGSC